MTIADPRLLFIFCCSLRRTSLISHRGIAFNGIPVEDSTSLLRSSNYPCPRYLSNDIPCTFRRCHCSKTSTPITASSPALTTRINKFDYWGRSIAASAFSVSKAEIDLDDEYRTRLSRILGSTPAFCSASLSASIMSASDLC